MRKALWDDSRLDTSKRKTDLAETAAWRAQRKQFGRAASRRRQALLEVGWKQADAACDRAVSDLQALARMRQFELEDNAASIIQRAVRRYLNRRREKRELEQKLRVHSAIGGAGPKNWQAGQAGGAPKLAPKLATDVGRSVSSRRASRERRRAFDGQLCTNSSGITRRWRRIRDGLWWRRKRREHRGGGVRLE